MQDPLTQLQHAVGDRYRIERELGRGGMATVFRAHDVRHDRTVAIKVLRPELAASLGSERFLREIQIAAKLTHPHILPLHDSGEAGDLLYYMMPFVAGESLRDKLSREGELPVNEALRVLRDVSDALAFAHKQGFVHRDIKPDNVMLVEAHALVADFGVAKAVTEASSTTQHMTSFGVAVGTPIYMSPEQAAGDPNIDHRADIYALGVMAYEMLAGRPPFVGETTQAVLARHVTEAPEDVRAFREAVPEWLAQLVMRCLEKKPADRWQSASEIRAQLEAYATPSGFITPTGAGTVSTSAETMLRRSHPTRVVATFGIAAAAVLGVAYAAVIGLGLPDWVIAGVAALVGVAFPVVVLTARAERRRAGVPTGAATRVSGERGIHRWLTWRRTLTGGGVAFSLLGVVTVIYMGMRLLGIGPVGTLVASGVFEQRERIVLAEFENHTTDSTLSETVTELFRIDLAQSRAVSVLEPGQLAQVLIRMERGREPLTAALAAEIAEREGLKAIVTGDVRSVGSGLVLSSRLVAAGTGEVLWAGRESATDASRVIEAVDRLSAGLRAKIGESLRTIRADAPLDQVTTRSTEALRKYAQADRANNQAEFDRAVTLLEEAIAADSNFAMAHRKLAIILRNRNQQPDRANQAFTTAYTLRNRLTERERYLAEAAYNNYVLDSVPGSINAYRSLLEKYPDDQTALNNLAVNYSALGRRQEAAELHLRALALSGVPAVTYTNAIGVLYSLGRVDTARAVLERFGRDYPGQPQVLTYRAAMAAAEFDFAAAERYTRELQAARRGAPTFEAFTALELANYALVQGKFRDARRLVLEGYDVQASNRLNFIDTPRYLFEAMVHAMGQLRYYNDRAGALETVDRVTGSAEWRRAPPQDREYLALAVVYAEAGQPGRATALIAEHRARVDSTLRRLAGQQAAVHEALGAVALAEGRGEDAIREFRAWSELLAACALCALPELGRAYDIAGQPDSAIAVLQRYVDTKQLFRTGSDNVNLVPSIRRLAQLYEARGDRERAVTYYNQFVELWRDADPEVQPAVAEVRQRIASLVGER